MYKRCYISSNDKWDRLRTRFGVSEPLGDLLEASGDGVEGFGDAVLGRRGGRGGRAAGEPGLVQLVGEQQAGHEEQAQVADVADLARHLTNVAVELLRQDADPLLLAVRAADRVGTAVDLHGDGAHQRPSCSARVSRMASAARSSARAASRPAVSSSWMRALSVSLDGWGANRASSGPRLAPAARLFSSSRRRSSSASARSTRSRAAEGASIGNILLETV